MKPGRARGPEIGAAGRAHDYEAAVAGPAGRADVESHVVVSYIVRSREPAGTRVFVAQGRLVRCLSTDRDAVTCPPKARGLAVTNH